VLRVNKLKENLRIDRSCSRHVQPPQVLYAHCQHDSILESFPFDACIYVNTKNTLCNLLQWVTTFLQELFKSSYKFSLRQLHSISDGSSSWGNVWKEQLIKIIYLWSEVVLEVITKKEKYHWTSKPHVRLFCLLFVCKCYRAKPVILLQSLKDHRNFDIKVVIYNEQHGHKEGFHSTT